MLTSLLAALVVMSAGPDDTVTMLPGKANGYFMLPGRVVCEGEAKSLTWSPDNQYLVVIRSQTNISSRFMRKMMAPGSNQSIGPVPADLDPNRNSVVVWSVADAKPIQVWAGRTSQDRCDQIALVGSNLYLMVRPDTSGMVFTEDAAPGPILLRCQLGSSTPQIVRRFDPGTDLRIAAVDQTSRSLLLSGHTANQSVLATVSAAGIIIAGDKNQLPKGLADALAANSRAWIGDENGDEMASFGAPVVPAAAINQVAPATSPVSQPATVKKSGDIRLLIRTIASAAKEVTGSVRALVYEDPDKPGKAYGIVAAGVGSRFALAADNSAVAYTQDNALVVREIVAIPLDVLKKMRAAAQKAMTMSNAKQAGTAMMMYCADYDDYLPANLSTDRILPYIMNPDMLNGFVYTFGGGKLSDIKDPANTELGYVTGPGGSAIIYADGHVMWKPD